MSRCRECNLPLTKDVLRHCDDSDCPYDDNGGNVVMSAAIGALTDSAILGGLLGGSIVGGILGDALDGDLMD